MAKSHTLEEKAAGVADYWLCGSYTRVASREGVALNTVKRWVLAAEGQKTAANKRLLARAEELRDQRKTSLDLLYQRAVELQLHDLPEADFRDRTGLIKIVGEQMLLQKGKPTSIEERRSSDRMDAEIESMLEKLDANGASANGHR